VREVHARQTWGFEVPGDSAWHFRLEQVLAKMDFIESTLLAPDHATEELGWSVLMRLELALQSENEFDPGGRCFNAWKEALPQIHSARADLDGDGESELIYPGLELSMQQGLQPLGPDPRSHSWEFAVVHTGDPVELDASGELIMTDSMAVVLVLLPEGSFVMGAQRADSAARMELAVPGPCANAGAG
jgi:hypothetical protein